MISNTPPVQFSSQSLDMHDLNALRGASLDPSKKQEALRETAKQLESMFLNMMLKSMRQANEAFSDGNMLEGKDTAMFRDMLDQQYASAMSSEYGIGLADVIVRQLDPMAASRQSRLGTAGADLAMPGQSKDNERQRSVAARAGRPGTLPLRHIETASRARPDDEFPHATRVPLDVRDGSSVEPGSLTLLNRPAKGTFASTPSEFVEKLLPHARRAGKALGVDPRAIIAQAALETGWGRHVMADGKGQSSYNLFGIKAGGGWQGNRVQVETTEYRQQVAVREVANFRQYDSLHQAFDDYVQFLQGNPRYAPALQGAGRAEDWGMSLQRAGYATDPAYGKKIADILQSDEISSLEGV